MIKWQDEGIIIDYRPHGESSAIVEMFTSTHGRINGVVKGGASRKMRPSLQPGQVAKVEFFARLDTHMGSLKIESKRSYTSALITDPLRLSCFQSMASLLKFGMTERDSHPKLYERTVQLLESHELQSSYVDWELTLLTEAGFHLELNKCAVTGADDCLAYVSPKTGCAVTAEAAGKWADQLLPYSSLFQSNEGDFQSAARTLEYFLTHWLASMIGKHKLPDARARFIAMMN